MPKTTLPASIPRRPDRSSEVVTEPTGVLQQRVRAYGLCVRTKIHSDSDPWFPLDEAGHDLGRQDKLAVLARRACQDCPVIAECQVVTLREESAGSLFDVHGLRGGLAPHERVALIRRRRQQGARS